MRGLDSVYTQMWNDLHFELQILKLKWEPNFQTHSFDLKKWSEFSWTQDMQIWIDWGAFSKSFDARKILEIQKMRYELSHFLKLKSMIPISTLGEE